MAITTVILGAIGLLLASIPVRFAMDMAGDIYKEIFQEKWVNWIKHFKKHTDPITAINTLKKYIKEDLDKTREDRNEYKEKYG